MGGIRLYSTAFDLIIEAVNARQTQLYDRHFYWAYQFFHMLDHNL